LVKIGIFIFVCVTINVALKTLYKIIITLLLISVLPKKTIIRKMTNRDLLKEAIADAKAVKEVAITNAKAALEEAFTPHLKEMFEKKLSEMEEEDEETMKPELEEAELTENELEELLKELEEGEDLLNNPKTSQYAHGNIAEEEEGEEEEKGEEEESGEEEEEGEKEEEEEVEIDLEDMSEEDLKKFIEEVVDEMIEAGELEAGHEGMEDEAGMEMEEPEMGAEEEVSAEEEMPMEEAKDDEKEKRDTEKMRHMEAELAEAIETIATLKSELHEINLLNSKLLYTNKIFKAKNLNEAQKVKVLTAFDKAETVKEVKLVFETLNEGLEKAAKKELVKESKGFASKPIGSSPKKQPVVEVNPVFERMRKLAGL